MSTDNKDTKFGAAAKFALPALQERLVTVEEELKNLSEALSIKSLTGRHVAYAWKLASLAKSPISKHKSLKQAGGNPGTTLPSEYFGDASWSYHPLAMVKVSEGSTDTTTSNTRGALPMKVLDVSDVAMIGGAKLTEFVTEKDFASTTGYKLSKEGMKAMANFSNSYLSLLMNVSSKLNKNTPVAFMKLARTL